MKNLKIPDSLHTELKIFSAKQKIDNMGYWAMGFILEGLKINKHKFENKSLSSIAKQKRNKP